MFFSAAKRAEVAAANPDFGITEVAKALGERWKTISDEEKNVYQQQADEDKIRYEREMTAYRAGAASAPAGEAAAADADADAPVAMDED